MSIQPKDLQFEHWLDRDWPQAPRNRYNDGSYRNESVQRAWVGWQACRAANSAPVPPAGDVEVDYPEFHTQGMGCGLEDRGITDRYEAMRHGWDEAIERCATEVVDPLIERVTRLAAERDVERKFRLAAEAGWREANRVIAMQRAKLDEQEAELTKARELLDVSHSLITFYLEQLVDNDSEPEDILVADQTLAEIQVALGRKPATPIARNVDDSCGQDAEAAKGEHCSTCSKLNGSGYCDCDQGGA